MLGSEYAAKVIEETHSFWRNNLVKGGRGQDQLQGKEQGDSGPAHGLKERGGGKSIWVGGK